MKCPYCDADIDNSVTECPICGKLITSNIQKEFHQYEQSFEVRNDRIASIIDAGKKYVHEIGSKRPSFSYWNAGMILWSLGWVLIFPVPLIVLIWRKNNKSINDALKIIITVAALLIYVIFAVSIGSALVRRFAESSKSTTDSVTEKYSSEDVETIKIPISSEDIKTLSIEEVYSMFEKAGFDNIEKEDIYDIDPDSADAKEYAEISISGQSQFEKDEDVSRNALIKCIAHYPFNKYTMNVSVDFIPNIIFDTYDVDFLVDGEKQEVIKHGNDALFSLRLREGDHTFTFCKSGVSSIKGETSVNADCDIDVEYKISCHGSQIDVETNYIDFKRDLPDDKAKVPCSNSEFIGKNYNDVINQFRELGFTDIKVIKEYDIIWGVTESGSVDYVTIAGGREYHRGDIFEKSSEIIVAYHLPYDDDPARVTPTPTPTPTPTTTPKPTTAESSMNDKPSAETTAKEEEPQKLFAAATTRVKVRKEPNTDCDVLGMLEEGDTIEIIDGKEDEWTHVLYENTEGFVKSEYLKEVSEIKDASTQTSAKSEADDKPIMKGCSLESVLSTAKKYGVSSQQFSDDDFGHGVMFREVTSSNEGLRLCIIYDKASKEVLCAEILSINGFSTADEQKKFIKGMSSVLCPSKDSSEISRWVNSKVGGTARTTVNGTVYSLEKGPVGNLLYYAGYENWEEWDLLYH